MMGVSTFSVRVPEEFKEKMRKADVVWSEEVRGFIEDRIRCLELSQTIDEVGQRTREGEVKVDSTELIREDRER
jgi:predicted DNA-binding protein